MASIQEQVIDKLADEYALPGEDIKIALDRWCENHHVDDLLTEDNVVDALVHVIWSDDTIWP